MSRTFWSVFMGKCLAVVWFILIFSSVDNAEYFTVTRGLSDGGSAKVEDIFTLPSSLCNANPKCPQFNGIVRSAQKCICECPRSKSTFAVNSGQLKCTENTLVRKPAGCTFKFYRTSEVNDPNASLEVVSSHYFRYLSPLKDNTRWSCQIVPSTSSYQDCAGNWLASANGWARFDISVETGTAYFRFALNPDLKNNYAHFNGKIVKLSVRCTGGQGQVEESCLLFKVKGPINCTANLPTTTVITTSATTSSEMTTTLKPSTAGDTTTSQVKSSLRPIVGKTTSNPLTIGTEVITHPPLTIAPMDNSSTVMKSSMHPTSVRTTVEDNVQGGGVEPTITGKGEKISKAGNDSSLVYILVGSVLAAAIIVLSVLLVIMCRRNSNIPLVMCRKKSTMNHDKENRAQTAIQMAPVYDDGNYMMPVQTSPDDPNHGRRKGFANPTYERGKDDTVKFRNYSNGTAGSHDGQKESSNTYTETDLLSAPLPPIPYDVRKDPGPSGKLQRDSVDVYEAVSNQSDDDQMYQSVDKFGPRKNETANVNFSAPMYCAPYHSSAICHGTKNSSVNNNTQERTVGPNSPSSPPCEPRQQEATYQALNSPPSSPTSPNGPTIGREYQPLVKVRSQVQQNASV